MNSQMLSSSMQRCAVAPRATVRTSACPLLRPVAQMRGLAQHPHAKAFTSYTQTKLHAQLTSSKTPRTIFTLQSSIRHDNAVTVSPLTGTQQPFVQRVVVGTWYCSYRCKMLHMSRQLFCSALPKLETHVRHCPVCCRKLQKRRVCCCCQIRSRCAAVCNIVRTTCHTQQNIVSHYNMHCFWQFVHRLPCKTS